jgi:hypothetical protein
MKDRDVLRAQMASRICAAITAQTLAHKSSFWGAFVTKKSFLEVMKLLPGMSVEIADEILDRVEKP